MSEIQASARDARRRKFIVWFMYLILASAAVAAPIYMMRAVAAHKEVKAREAAETAHRLAAERAEWDACRAQWAGKDKVPVVGGAGWVDVSKLRKGHVGIGPGGDECGFVVFKQDFHWDGGKLFPIESIPANNKLSPKITVVARWDNQRVKLACEEKGLAHDFGSCVEPEMIRPRKPWPRDLVVKSKVYPGLEIYLNPKTLRLSTGGGNIAFHPSNWPKNFRKPSINCWNIKNIPLGELDAAQLEWLELKNGICDVKWGGRLYFKGGVASIRLYEDGLPYANEILHSLYDYLSGMLIKEN